MKILIWIIIILSLFYISKFILVYNTSDIKLNGPNSTGSNLISPYDVLSTKIIPHSEITNHDHLPIDKNEVKEIVIPPIQPDVSKPPKCDITIGANRPQFKNNFEANYNDVGADISMIKENNPILTDIRTMLNNDTNILMSYEDDLYGERYQELNPQIIVDRPEIKSDKFPNNILYDNNKYNFIGVAYNEYYNQYYLVYENIINSSTLQLPGDNLDYVNYKVASYILAKMNDNKELSISHVVGPRNKINYNEIVYFSCGNFQLGPLTIKQIN